MSVKLSEVLAGLRDDADMKKIAEGTESPLPALMGDTVADEKAKIQTQLLEAAGMQEEAAADAAAIPLNETIKATAGEKVSPPEIAASEMGEVVAAAITKLPAGERKVACKKIIEKIASMNVLSSDDVKDVKTASAQWAQRHDVAGRIMARAYHDEINKLATAAVEKEAADAAAAEKKAEAEKLAAEKAAEAKPEVKSTEKVAAEKGPDYTDLLKELGA